MKASKELQNNVKNELLKVSFVLILSKYANLKLSNNEILKDLIKRFKWDLFCTGKFKKLTYQIKKESLKDNHINTLLKSQLKILLKRFQNVK